MERRDFLKLAAFSGLSVVTPMGFARRAGAEEAAPYDGPFFVMLKAAGGWDPTYLTDPKGSDVNSINQRYARGDILTAGQIEYAPVAQHKAFFDKYHKDLLVLNGVDMSTNSHNSGKRYAWTGRMDNAGYPTFSALVAAAKSPKLPLSYLSFGGYDATGNVIPLARVSNAERVNMIANANLISNDENRPYHSDFAADKIAQARQARHQAMHDDHHLPRVKQSMSTLFTSRLSANQLKRITSYLPETLPSDGLQKQATIALAAYKAGLCVSVNLVLGGFDTHNDHDNRQIPRLSMILSAIDYLMEQAETLQIRDKIVLMAGSDFGRTPKYNKDNGKDHWSVSSMMFMGPGITGNRVLGGTDEEQKALGLDKDTLKPKEGSSFKLRPEHVHHALRELAGVQTSDVSKQFELEGESMPKLFQP